MLQRINLIAIVLFFLFTGCANKVVEKTKILKSVGFDAELTEFKYPHTVQFFNFKGQNQNLKMAYMDVPAKNFKANDKAYVLFHGKNFSGYYFESIIDFLTQNGFRVIILDQIGFGKSTKPANYQYSFHELAENSHQLIKSLNINTYYVLGHSMGGMLATRYALMYPAEVKALALINPIGLEDWKTMAGYQTLESAYQTELSNTLEKAREYQKQSYYDGAWKDEYDKLLIPLDGWLKGPDKDILAWNAALTSNMIFTQPIIYEVKNLNMPTLLINGTRDRTAISKSLAPKHLQEKMGRYDLLGKSFQRLNSKIRLIEIPGLGHVPFIEAPEQFWKAAGQALLFK